MSESTAMESRDEMVAALRTIGITPNTDYPDEAPWLTVTEPHGEEPADSLADALATMQRAAENDGATNALPALLDRLQAVLREHYFLGVTCDHEAKTDVAHCYCVRWNSEPLPSVGAAVDAWINHVVEEVRRG